MRRPIRRWVVAPTYSAAVLADSPLLWWRLADTGGTVIADGSGNGRVGTLQNGGSIAYAQTGLINDGNKAMKASGDASFLSSSGSDISPATGSGPWTVEAWTRPDALSDNADNLIFLQFSGGAYASLEPRSSGAARLYWGADPAVDIAGIFTAGATRHIVLSFDGVTSSLFADGSLAWSGSKSSIAGTGSVFILGCTIGGVWNGTFDEAALYSTALSSSRAAAHYAAGIT